MIIFLLVLTDSKNPLVSEEKYIQRFCGWRRKQHLPHTTKPPPPEATSKTLPLPLSPVPGVRESEHQKRALEWFNLPPVLEPSTVLQKIMHNNQVKLKGIFINRALEEVTACLLACLLLVNARTSLLFTYTSVSKHLFVGRDQVPSVKLCIISVQE